MRKKVLLFVLFLSLCMLLGISVSAESETWTSYTVREEDEKYILSDGNVSVAFNSFNEILIAIDDGSILTFDGIFLDEEAIVSKRINVRGSLVSNSDIVIKDGGELTVSGGSLTFSKSSLVVLNGSLNIVGGTVSSVDGCAIRANSENSFIKMTGGRIASSGVTPALVLESGEARLSGGIIENGQGTAIESCARLSIGGVLHFNSGAYDIITNNPIEMTVDAVPFSGSAKIKYSRSFSKGELVQVLLNATEGAANDVKLYDVNNKLEELRYFEALGDSKDVLAVYKPYTVRFISEGKEIDSIELLSGEKLALPDIPERAGYAPRAWRTAIGEEGELGTELTVTSDLTLYASYTLLAPEFALKSREAVYDGKVHALSFDKLTHPCIDQGFFTYRWLDKEGKTVSESPELQYSEVSDSGLYKCIISFHLGQDSVTVETPYVEIKVHKRIVTPPTVTSEYYTGKPIYPDIPRSMLYTFSDVGYVNAGSYVISVKLTDSANNCFADVSGDEYLLAFEILKASNEWIGEISITDVYYGAELNFSATSKFGEAAFFFSSSIDGEYLETVPGAIGTYFVKACVAGSDNYTALSSEPRSFEIIDDSPISLTLLSAPIVTEYRAFDYLLRDGLEFSVIFASGRRARLSGTDIIVHYQKDKCFRYGDTAFFAEYLGLRTSVPVTVTQAEYSFDLPLDIAVYSYDGTYKTYPLALDMPIGKDGIQLSYVITGGGSNTGTYDVCISFASESVDYRIPDPIFTKLVIEKMKVEPIWQNTEFIYDGTFKCPAAYYIDCYGARIPLQVEGGSVAAGSEFIATAVLNDNNYALASDSVKFTVNKAYYDMSGVSWSNTSFIYDGEEKSVFITGLPDGVYAIGYTDNYATDAGEYRASVALSYDSLNYNQPTVPSFTWVINKADYDMSDVAFRTEFTYDGELHYPEPVGEVPIGKDGIKLGYTFSRGVRNVNDNRFVIVSFSTESNNYNVPEQIVCEVVITPMEIIAVWGELCFVYSGEKFTPTASCNECALTVSGGGTDAGIYTAVCASLDANYVVTNFAISFEIVKANNVWLTEPSVEDVFFGRSPCPLAEPYFGIAEYRYYSDCECINEVDPVGVGRYYAVATVPESTNYLELVSSPLEFYVIEIVPIGISVTIKERDHRAFDILDKSDFICETVNNDGSRAPVDSSLVKVIYENGESLLAADKSVGFKYGEFSTLCDIKVLRAVYDTSAVEWCGLETVYDGRIKAPDLIGLPNGVTLVSIDGVDAVNAGEYELTAHLEYDSENYEAPIIPRGVLVISKKVIVPEIKSGVIYNGAEQYPEPLLNIYRPISERGYKNVGEYTVEFALIDADNYEFGEGNTAKFIISPKDVAVKLNKINVYLFEDARGAGYSVTSGEVYDGDDLMLDYVFDGERVYASSSNPNYNVTVYEGVIEYVPRPTPEVAKALFICLLLAVILLLIVLMGFRNRSRIAELVSDVRSRRQAIKERRKMDYLTVELPKLGEVDSSGISVSRADELLSNSIAKTLIRYGSTKIKTAGRKRAIINVDTLSEAFMPGDTVDINTLKEKGLVPKDAGYLKVLARGSIDKALKVYANSYSISAVKMIALLGGEVNRVSTIGIKENRKK